MPLGKNKKNFVTIVFLLFLLAVLFSETVENEDKIENSLIHSEISFDKESFINEIIESYSNSCISGTRIMMETGESARYRYEYVMRKGHDKIVSLKMPYRVTWYRQQDEGFIILDGKKILMEDKMKDLEDVYLEDIQKEIIDIHLTEIQYSGIPAYYVLIYLENCTYRVILLQESMQFIRLEKETDSKLTVMLYDNLNQGNKKDFANQLSWYQDIPTETAENLDLTKDSTLAYNNPINEDTLLKDFEVLLQPVIERFSVQKTEMIEFSDARAMFITMTDPQESNPFVIVIIIHDNAINPSNSESILGKIPETYNMCQKISNKVEINVIGSQDKSFLEEISNLMLETIEK
ncbi:MAG: hypothetical protein U9N62_11750 [Thermotogota bacterium]|nr:hypothetical protein [Thermotogota bacterium]